MPTRDLKNATVKIKDGGSNAITLKIGNGSISWTQTQPREYILDRGSLDTVRNGNDEPMSVTLNCTFEFLIGDTGDTVLPYEAITRSGNASAWASTSANSCEPYACDIEITYDPTCASADNEVTLLPDFRFESINPDLAVGELNVDGKCNAKAPTLSRVAPS